MSTRYVLGALIWIGAGAGAAATQVLQNNTQDPARSPVQRSRTPGVTGAGGQGGGLSGPMGQPAVFPQEFRSIDGSGNNIDHPEWGAADTPFLRLVHSDYADGVGQPGGAGRPAAREASNIVVAQTGDMPNGRGASDYLWMWGQLLDHDIAETPVADPAEAFDIRVPSGDPWFDPGATGTQVIPLDRSAYDVVSGVREQVNLITAYIDGSNVYGSDEERAHELRALDGTGRLKTSPGDLLPFNEAGLPNAPTTGSEYFLAGDVRANEQVALTAMHTLFMREHNYWARRVAAMGVTGEERIYQYARAIVAAEMQAITYREFLPVLLGPGALPPYMGYRSNVDASIANVFAAAGYRVGHTMLSPVLLRVQADGSTHPAGDLGLASAFFSPDELLTIGLEPYLRGLGLQQAQEIDPFVIDELRNFLFDPPGSGGFDLASLNIQRGRDHGLPSYNGVRMELGYAPATSMAYISSNPEIQSRLEEAYTGVDDIDVWVGLLSEDHVPGAVVGETLRTLLADQFGRLRDGDRFFYRAYMPPGMVQLIDAQTLSTIIRRNTEVGAELAANVFLVP